MKNVKGFLALTAGLMLSAGANASLLGLYGDADTSAYVIPSNNDYAPAVGWNGFIGGHLFNSSASSILVTYEYLYKEASFNNTFSVGGVEAFKTDTTAYGATTSEVVASLADLSFSFTTGKGKKIDNDRTSAKQNNDSKPQNFFLYFDDAEGSVYALLDDAGAGPDDNHDDMIIKITAVATSSEVPEPASAALLGLGLVGAGLMRRRSKA